MNPLQIFREFLHSGDKQLLDIFEDYGEEKPESVTMYIYVFKFDYSNQWLVNSSTIAEDIKQCIFNSKIEFNAFMMGAKFLIDHIVSDADMVMFSNVDRELLVKEVLTFIKNEYDDDDDDDD